jgi:hypothetical protein
VKMRLCASILLDFLSNLGQFHMVGVQAHNLDIAVDPGVVPWLGTKQGDVHTGYGELTNCSRPPRTTGSCSRRKRASISDCGYRTRHPAASWCR